MVLYKFTHAGTVWPNPVADALLDFYVASLAICVTYLLSVQYCVASKRRSLLAAIAFTGLAIGKAACSLSILLAHSSPGYLRMLLNDFNEAWQIAAALLLIAAARNTTWDIKYKCRRHVQHSLFGVLGFSLLVFGLSVRLVQFSPHLQRTLSAFMAGHYQAPLLVYMHSAMSILTAGLMLTAVTIFARELVERRKPNNDGFIGCLLLLAAGQISMLLSASGYDVAYWMSHVYQLSAYCVLLAKLASEFGASYEDAHTRIEHLEAVHFIASRLNGVLDLRMILLTFVSDAAKMLSARFSAIMLADDACETLTTIATYGLRDSPFRPSEPLPVNGSGRPAFYSGHTARAVKERRICIVDDVYTDIDFVPWRLLAKYDGYTVSVPLIFHDKILGVLNMFFDRDIPSTEERTRLFQTLAASASVAIANAQLYDATRYGDIEDSPIEPRLAS